MVHTVLPNKRQQHSPEPLKVLHRSTEIIYDEHGAIKKIKSSTYKRPETVEREKKFLSQFAKESP